MKSIKKGVLSGQALLIVVLIISVVLVISLSFVSRSITDISVTNLEEDATRAFSAAEAGVEQALLDGQVGVEIPVNFSDSRATVNVSLSEVGSSFNYPQPVFPGDSVTFWFVENDGSGNLSCSGGRCARPANVEICYGAAGTPNNSDSTPAIEVSFFFDSSPQSVVNSNNFANVNVIRRTADVNTARRAQNNFTEAVNGCGINNTYAFSTGNINLNSIGISCFNQPGCLLLAKVRVLYGTNAHPVGIRIIGGSLSELPPQGRLIDSVGTAGNATRRVQVFQGFPEPPSVFDSAIFSINDLTK